MKANLRSEQKIVQNWKGDVVVSISCLAYNHEKFIEDALEGFLIQETTFPFEILIHDDASTDNTANIIREYEKAYPNIIKPIYQKENQYSKRIEITKEYILPKVKGKYIALCEGDDYWTDPLKLKTQIEYMEKNTKCSMTTHSFNTITPDKKILNITCLSNSIKVLTPEDAIMSDIPLQSATRVLRKEILTAPRPNFFFIETGDYPLLLFALSKGEIHFLPFNMSNYRYLCDGSWTKKTSCNPQKRIECFTEIKNFLIKYNKFTNYKFDKIIKRKCDIFDYECAKLKHNYRDLYKCNIFRQLSIKRRLKILLGVLFSNLKKK